ncbi:MAG: Alcohol dehydrogenase [Syntrophaceae bacterium PtaU1.Bin231]|nr:MAG: Alcohol dehydrogenase [Syntrophaceae bacterium PtaU1.Bin231]
MKAWVLQKTSDLRRESEPLAMCDLPEPSPAAGEIVLRVSACGICHTELDEIEGRTPPPAFPVIPGHQVVGIVHALGTGASLYGIGRRVGVGWIFSACGSCEYCRDGRENLCPDFRATGRDRNGGYAEYMAVPEAFVHPIPALFSDAEAAPLLCAGAIGYRSLRLAQLADGQSLGLTGFGASAHLVLMMVRHLHPKTRVFVFARREEERRFALDLGASWAGGIDETSPERLHAIIDTTPAWRPVVEALRNLRSGGRLVVNAIRKERSDQGELQRLDYASHLWMEKRILSVANVARRDISEFLQLAAVIPVRPQVVEYPLDQANRALLELKAGRIRGAKVLRVAT